ncbi:MAG: hypothetical protein ACKO17_00635, partial [Bacteroidota bacterium]
MATGNTTIKWDLATPGNCEYADELADVIPNTSWNNGSVMSGSNSNSTSGNSCSSSLISTNNTPNQTVGVNNSIQPIVYQTTGATGAVFFGLPPGVSGVWSNNTIVISGTPTGTGTFPFSFILTGVNCTGSLFAQTVCVGQPIQNILLTTTGATGVVASGLPLGVTANWQNNQVTINGIPTVTGNFNYIVTTTGGCSGGNNSVSGSMVVKSLNTISLQNGSPNRSVCLQQAISSINFLTTGATGAYATGLPAGIFGEWLAGVFTISGSTSLSGLFPYTVRMTGGCPGNLDSINGLIQVLPHTASSIQASICNGQSYAFGNQSLNQSGVYSRTVVGANGCDSVITLTLDVEPIDTTYLGTGNSSLVYSNSFQNNTLGWNSGQVHWWNGSQMLGPFSNMNLEFNQSNLPSHDSLFVEFDFYLHDSWDASEPFQISLNSQVLGTYYFGYWYNSNYSELTYLGMPSISARCYWWYWSPWGTRSYRARFKVPHTSSTMNFRINVLGDQDPCDESWSLDNFKVDIYQFQYKICEGTSLTVGNQSLTSA